MYWNGWSIDRITILFISLAFLMIGIQVTLFHYRQNFHHRAMWIPVIAAPLFFIAGLAYSFYHVNWLATILIWFMWIGLLSGLIGFYYHFRGVGVRVGGWDLRNFLLGPPIMLPLLYTAISAFALIVLIWR